jgi:hypothetical protein
MGDFDNRDDLTYRWHAGVEEPMEAALTQRESACRLAKLAGTQPDLTVPSCRRPDPT